MESKTIQHFNPVWKVKANYILRVRIPGDFRGYSSGWEQIWSRKLASDAYEVCCIPFFLYDVSLGDHVRINEEHQITEIIKRSGHFTFRVWFGDSKDSSIQTQVLKTAQEGGCFLEFYNNNLLGIDTPTRDLAQYISGYLLEKQQLGLLVYETGQTKPFN